MCQGAAQITGSASHLTYLESGGFRLCVVDIPEEMYLSLLLSIRRTFTKSLRKVKGRGCFGMRRGLGGEQIPALGLPGKAVAKGRQHMDTAPLAGRQAACLPGTDQGSEPPARNGWRRLQGLPAFGSRTQPCSGDAKELPASTQRQGWSRALSPRSEASLCISGRCLGGG